MVLKKTGPYIGVTGFMSKVEIDEALSVIPQGATHRLMAGYLMSSKTLASQQNKWPGRYPKKETIQDLLVDDERVLNLVHYSTDNPETLCSQLVEITKLAGRHLNGFQLNMAWPKISELEDYRHLYPDKFVVLQVGKKAMAQVGLSDFELSVGAYAHVIDAILIDASGGTGEPLNATMAADYLWEIVNLGISLGVAGGLGPRTLNLIEPLIRQFHRDLSIDAEGRLRTPQPEDKLCLDSMKAYVSGSFLMFKFLP
ncbi:MAG: hypothetical protein A2651_02570 [Candidatus Yanofskybacteria bacterium RIFCSPHIGHO2_01_FULL_42_12]|uniref:Phosphoribosylanthranilate isomerase n=1 Tax=Candidatus Yanofskybacteria bacterium RIFCSPLOWO2_01_FULL_42_49 TaxID=1802694 RepID=A0A1F8GD96_9BACT|nr:MAG: hypothetical protein A2651_02570 [Candidatus Yanofskybacteria bacterium RIFCSPHIGHO2_01_FULL_42_12]OGN22718.1 MAG: hypothetical protein A2918_01205 [Candidatus Yanofskybacteria bacterium RIFCSPLOWO2_01_FULL_42_49]